MNELELTARFYLAQHYHQVWGFLGMKMLLNLNVPLHCECGRSCTCTQTFKYDCMLLELLDDQIRFEGNLSLNEWVIFIDLKIAWRLGSTNVVLSFLL